MKFTSTAFLTFLDLAACGLVTADTGLIESNIQHLKTRALTIQPQCNISTPGYTGKANVSVVETGIVDILGVDFLVEPASTTQIYCSNDSAIFFVNNITTSQYGISGLNLVEYVIAIGDGCADADGNANGEAYNAETWSVIVASSTC